MEPLLQPWTDALGTSPEVERAGRDLLARWAEPHRRYHDLTHLGEVLRALTTLTGGAPPPVPVVLAAYAHDAVYDPRAADNEDRSADLAAALLGRLGLPAATVEGVRRLVRLTAGHEPAGDDDAGALLCDADLAVLASSPDRYRAYAEGVRAEYGHLVDDVFRRGRAAVLRGLAERPRLFATPRGRDLWEAAARQNLAAELAALEPGGPAG